MERIFLGIVNIDKKREEVNEFLNKCKKLNTIIEISNSIIPKKESEKILKSKILIIILSKDSVCSTWILGILEEMQLSTAKKFFIKIDNIDLPRSFNHYLKNFKEIQTVEELCLY